MQKPILLLAVAAASLVLGGCDRGPAKPKVSISRAWVRLPALPGGAGAGYFTAEASTADTLLAVSGPGLRIALHESMSDHGMMTMRPLASVPLAAGERIAFAPAGRHLMIFGLDAPGRARARAGQRIALTFRFRAAPPVTVEARIVGPGAGPPGDGD
jgi:hypothetical protein